MRTRSTATELQSTRTAIRAIAATHHAEDVDRGRQAVVADPDGRNHRRGAAEWMMQQRKDRITVDEADIDDRIRHRAEGGTGPDEWTYELMHRVAVHTREVAYWEGVRDAAHD